MVSAGLVLAAGLIAPPTDPPSDPRTKPAAYELSWTAPDECPTADAIRERVDALAAEASGGHGTMFVGATVSPVDHGYSLELKTEHEGRKDTRTVEATTCDELGESTALLVAISLHPVLAENTTTPETEPESETVVEPQTAAEANEPGPLRSESHIEAVADPTTPTETAPPSTPAPPRERRRLAPGRLAIRLAPGIEFGAMPELGGTTQAALSLVWDRLRLELVGAYLWPRRGDANPPALYQAGVVGARACAQPGAPRVRFPLCLGIEAGTLRADSRGLDPPRNVHGPWLGIAASAGVAVGGERLGFWSAAELVGAVVRTRVLVDQDLSFGALPVSLRLLAGLEIFFSIDSKGAGQPR